MGESLSLDLSFDRLALLMSRVWCAPVMTNTINMMARVLAHSTPRPSVIEPIVAVDAGLTALVLRSANLKNKGLSQSPITRIQWALVNLDGKGIREVLAKSRLQQLTTSGTSKRVFDLIRFGRHCSMSAQLAQIMFRKWRTENPAASNWSSEDVLTIALLQNFGRLMLSKVAPGQYVELEAIARKEGLTVDQAFTIVAGHPLAFLTSYSLQSMHLPETVTKAIEHLPNPENHPFEPSAVAIIAASRKAVEAFGVALDPWAPRPTLEDSDLGPLGFMKSEVTAMVRESVMAVGPYLPKDRRQRSADDLSSEEAA